jgi:hypothetical protein
MFVADWHSDALCAELARRGELPLSDFFPSRHTCTAAYKRARRVCAACPVRAACLDEALRFEADMPSYFRAGLFGGCSPEQRAALAREPRAAAV